MPAGWLPASSRGRDQARALAREAQVVVAFLCGDPIEQRDPLLVPPADLADQIGRGGVEPLCLVGREGLGLLFERGELGLGSVRRERFPRRS